MYNITITREAEKALDKIDNRYFQRIQKAMDALAEQPFSGKKLSGEFEKYFSLRVWPYRIIYSVSVRDRMILIIRVGHRQGVYK